MKILTDYQIFHIQHYGGISRYHANINEYINQNESGNKSFILNIGSKNHYTSPQLNFLKVFNRSYGRGVIEHINQIATSIVVDRFDVFHPTYYNPYFLKFKKLPPYVITIHDMIPELLHGNMY